MRNAPKETNSSVISVFDFSCSDKPSRQRTECTTAKAVCSSTTRTCATVWMWTAWAASTPAPSAAHANVEWSAAVTGSGFTSRWRWRVERSSGTSLLFKLAAAPGLWALRGWGDHGLHFWTELQSPSLGPFSRILKRLFYNVTDVYQIFFKAPVCGRIISITTQEDRIMWIMEVHFVAVSWISNCYFQITYLKDKLRVNKSVFGFF